jgi:uncharacterized membrane protein
MWPLFAVRSAWVAVFFVGIGVFVLWFLLRVVGDLIVWFREEILDDYRELRRSSEIAQSAKQKNESGQPRAAEGPHES